MQIEVEEIKKIKLDPGEVLWVTVPIKNLEQSIAEGMANRLSQFFPDNKVIVTAQGFEFKAIAPPNS